SFVLRYSVQLIQNGAIHTCTTKSQKVLFVRCSHIKCCYYAVLQKHSRLEQRLLIWNQIMIRHWLPRSLVVLVAMLAFAGTAATASAQDKLDRALREGKASGQAQHVIVKSKPGYEAWARQLLQQNGKTVEAELPSIGGLAVELTAEELELCKSSVLAGCSLDSYISPSAATGPSTAPRRRGKREAALETPTITAAKMNTQSINTLLGTLGLTPSTSFGYGVTVALIDSGIYPSSAFTGRIKAFYDFTGGTIQSKPAFDDYGHGTHVAGLIG